MERGQAARARRAMTEALARRRRARHSPPRPRPFPPMIDERGDEMGVDGAPRAREGEA